MVVGVASVARVAVVVVALLCHITFAEPLGLYGCNTDDSLCVEDEACLDDGLFGQCQVEGQQERSMAPLEFLSETDLQLLQILLNRLVNMGLSWRQPKVQCVVAYFLLTTKYGLSYDADFCNVRRPENVWAFVKIIQETLRQQSKAELPDPEMDVAPVEEVDEPVLFLDHTPTDDGNEAEQTYVLDDPITSNELPPLLGYQTYPADEAIDPNAIVSQPFVDGGDVYDDDASRIRANVLQNIIRDVEPPNDGGDYISKRSAVDANVADGALSPEERAQFEQWLSSQAQGEPINLSDVSDEQLDKYIVLVRLMKAELENLMDADGDTTVGEIEQPMDDAQSDERAVNLLKKDTERLGDVNIGMPVEHKIVKGDPNVRSPIDHMFHRIDGNRVYIRLQQNITDDRAKMLQLVSFLEDKIGRPNNLTFTDFVVEPSEISFMISPLMGVQPDHEWLQQLFDVKKAAPPSNGHTQSPAEFVADTVYKRRSDVAHIVRSPVSETGIGGGVDKVPTHGGGSDAALSLVNVFACSVLAVLALGLLAVYVLRDRRQSAAAVKRLSTDIEGKPSKAYEELCRQRMAGRGDSADSGPISGVVNTVNQRLGSQSGDNQSPTQRSSTSSWSEEPLQATDMDVTTGHAILRYLEDHLADKGRLDADWQALEAYQPDQAETTVAEKTDNRSKNRFPDVLPYDHALVSLRSESAIDLGAGADFINASPLCDHDPHNPVYIAAQAPLVSTAAEFWQMIWEQGSVVIVNLTKLSGENGDALCHRYWPENGSEIHGIFEVHLVSEHIWCEDYLVRSFYLKNMRTNETRTVTQFHFLSWPDHGVPPNSKLLLEFRRKVNKSYRGRSCPIVVHCSDGAGRAGTYCLLDMVLNRINKGVKEIDPAATLEHLRDQRMHVVRTKAQYELVLRCIAEEVSAMLKALPQ